MNTKEITMYFNEEESAVLLNEIKKTPEQLFASLPASVKTMTSQNISAPLSELQTKQVFKNRERDNSALPNFCGYGLYRHFIPEAVSHLSSLRGFVTSYTPYQPEVAQGTLQALFEYQSLMAKLTDMDIANASLYEAATAMVEAIRMALRQKRSKEKGEIVFSEAIHPDFIKVAHTYFPPEIQDYLGISFVMAPVNNTTGATEWDGLALQNPLAVVYQNPNVFGVVENEAKSLPQKFPTAQILYGTADVLSLSVLSSPKEYGAHIVWGEAQALGMPVSMGGPGLGFLAADKQYVRQMPGRLIGQTSAQDAQGEKTTAYLITLATREQHIRREKATSNICSNQSLMAVRAGIFMSALGWQGMQELALRSADNLHYFQQALQKSSKASLTFAQAENFHEITWKHEDENFYQDCLDKGIIPGVLLTEGNFAGSIVSYFSELDSREQIDELIALL